MKKRTKLTVRQIRAINRFLDNCINSCNSDESHLVHLYEAAKINWRAEIGQTVLKG